MVMQTFHMRALALACALAMVGPLAAAPASAVGAEALPPAATADDTLSGSVTGVDAAVSAAAVRAPSQIRVGLVRTATAAGTRDYISGTALNTNYDARIKAVQTLLVAEGFVVGTVDDNALANVSTLERYDVLVFPMALATTSAQRTAIRAYTARGGGIVATFALSRWDARTAYTYGYLPFLGMQGYPGVYTWPPSTSDLKPWEWGEISEIYNTTFHNDPMMYGGYRLEQASKHWIMLQTAAEAGSTLMIDKPNRYNEVVDTLPGAKNVTMLYRYNTLTNGNSGDDSLSGYLAGWTSDYYFGRMAYFAFHLHDLILEGWAADATTARVARRVLVNSVRWAGSCETYRAVPKAAQLTGRAWYTRETLFIDETVTNTGETSLRGPLKVEVADPSGKVVYTGQAYNDFAPLPPGRSYTHKSYTVPLKCTDPKMCRHILSATSTS